MENDIETRMFESLEIRAEGDKPRLVGYAAVFNKLSYDLGGFTEKIAPGAFTRTLKDVESGKRVVNSFFNHDKNWLLASTANKTMRLREDDRGLYMEMEPMMTNLNEHPISLIKAGGVRHMSFAFRIFPDGKDEWEYKKGHDPIRTLLDVDLFDASPVVEPAFPQTSIEARNYVKSLLKQDGQGAPRGRVDGLVAARFKLR